MKYKELIEKYINGSISKEVSQRFCGEFMDAFYADQDELQKEVSKEIYEIFDDLNLVCDSYEPNVQIRGMDRYCIDEMFLKNRVVELYKKSNIDRKFYQAGGEQEGRSREQYRTYEVRSMELRRVGDAVMWDGKQLNEKTLKMCQQEPPTFYKIIGMRKALADNSYRAKRGNCVFGTDMLCTKLLSCFRY